MEVSVVVRNAADYREKMRTPLGEALHTAGLRYPNGSKIIRDLEDSTDCLFPISLSFDGTHIGMLIPFRHTHETFEEWAREVLERKENND